jgi:hypothetical protein
MGNTIAGAKAPPLANPVKGKPCPTEANMKGRLRKIDGADVTPSLPTPGNPGEQTYECPPYRTEVIGPDVDMSKVRDQLRHANEQLQLTRHYPGRDPPSAPTTKNKSLVIVPNK